MVEVTKEATLHRDDDDAGVIGVGASEDDEKLLFAKEGHTRVNFRIFFSEIDDDESHLDAFTLFLFRSSIGYKMCDDVRGLRNYIFHG